MRAGVFGVRKNEIKATINQGRGGEMDKKTIMYDNCRGRGGRQKNTTTNRMDQGRKIRSNADGWVRRGIATATQQSTEVEIMLFFIVFTSVSSLLIIHKISQ